MTTLYLLRHAKAVWASPGMKDFDRPLDAVGVTDAENMGLAMHIRGFTPALTLCSNAARARQTLESASRNLDPGRVVRLDDLYSEDAMGYLELVREHGADNSSILLIGHNPMVEDVAIAAAGTGEEAAFIHLNFGFPTTGLAVIDFEGPLTTVKPRKGRLRAFLTPADKDLLSA